MTTFLAVASLGLATALAAAPWPGPVAAVAMALLPAVVLHYWALRRSGALPELAIVFAGLSVDLVSGGPLGQFTVIYVLAWAIGLWQRPWAARWWKPGRFGLLAVALAVAGASLWGLGQALGEPAAGPLEIAAAVGILVAAAPFVSAFLRLADGARVRGFDSAVAG